MKKKTKQKYTKTNKQNTYKFNETVKSEHERRQQGAIAQFNQPRLARYSTKRHEVSKAGNGNENWTKCCSNGTVRNGVAGAGTTLTWN